MYVYSFWGAQTYGKIKKVTLCFLKHHFMPEVIIIKEIGVHFLGTGEWTQAGQYA